MILSFFTNLIFTIFQMKLAYFLHIDELGVSQTSVRGGASPQHRSLFFCSLTFFWLCVSVSATESSEVLPLFFPPPTFSSVKVWGVVVVVGGCGGTDSSI